MNNFWHLIKEEKCNLHNCITFFEYTIGTLFRMGQCEIMICGHILQPIKKRDLSNTKSYIIYPIIGMFELAPPGLLVNESSVGIDKTITIFNRKKRSIFIILWNKRDWTIFNKRGRNNYFHWKVINTLECLRLQLSEYNWSEASRIMPRQSWPVSRDSDGWRRSPTGLGDEGKARSRDSHNRPCSKCNIYWTI